MPEPIRQSDVASKLDAIVLAGTRGARHFEVDGRVVGKPYLTLGGEPLVRRVARQVLASARIEKVFVVGDTTLLSSTLEPLREQAGQRLHLVQEGDDILDNCYRAFFQHLLPARGLPPIEGARFDRSVMRDYQKSHPEAAVVPALFLCSDLPFIDAADIDSFLEHTESDVTLTLGLINHRSLQQLHSDLGEFATLENLKLGALLLREYAVRINNLFFVRPLRADPVFFECVREIYTHRNLLTPDGRVNWRNWWEIGRSILRQSRMVRRPARFMRGLCGLVTAMMALTLARSTHRVSSVLSKPFRLLVGKRDIEFILSLLMDTPMRLNVSTLLGPAIDIDVEESYRTLASHDEKNFRRVLQYLERSHAEDDESVSREATP